MQVQDEYSLFCGRIKQLTGIELVGYKERQMRRRLESQMARYGLRSFLAYSDLLVKDKQVLQEFLDRMTINVSEFFRNSERWVVLERKVLPALQAAAGHRTLEIWSAACSTGEEPYSLAMLLTAAFPRLRWHLRATDIDARALVKAKDGVYQLNQLSQIPERFRQRYVQVGGNDTFSISPEIKGAVDFRQHNLLNEAYQRDLDLIICRNVMIYFTEEVKDRLYRNFAASLRPGGVLFVGSTEQIFQSREYGFKAFDSFFYQKLEHGG
jgi:chemotaxis protein methyltransferase CheR